MPVTLSQMHNNNNWHFGKRFEDRACVEELPFICEKDMPAKVCPSKLQLIHC